MRVVLLLHIVCITLIFKLLIQEIALVSLILLFFNCFNVLSVQASDMFFKVEEGATGLSVLFYNNNLPFCFVIDSIWRQFFILTFICLFSSTTCQLRIVWVYIVCFLYRWLVYSSCERLGSSG